MLERFKKDPLAEVLAVCIEKIEGGESLDQVLKRYPAMSDELSPLLETYVKTSFAAHEKPDPVFKSRLRYRLEGAVLARTGQPSILPRLWLAATAIALVIIVVIAGGAIGVSARSLPGSPLYPIKRAYEDARLAMARDRAKHSWLELNFAERRLLEAQAIWEKKRSVWEGGLLEMTGIIETVLEEYEANPEYGGGMEVLPRIKLLETRIENFLALISDEAPIERTRSLAGMLSQYISGWSQRTEKLLGRLKESAKGQSQ